MYTIEKRVVFNMQREEITSICKEIAERFDIYKIFLYNERHDFQGNISSFKICVISNTEDEDKIEKEIYLDFDLPIPFDVLVYSKNNWNKISSIKNSFANSIKNKGHILYA